MIVGGPDTTSAASGRREAVHRPSAPILIESGRVVFGVGPPMTSGQFPTFEEGGFDPLCEALAP